MDANNAINLLNETFQNEFDLNQYQKFLRELFNTSQINVRNLTKYIKNEFAEYANSVLELGHYTDELGDSIVFYVIELAKESSRDRARTMQRNLVSTFMKDRHDYALVAFYEPNSDDWRFSYVKIEYEFNEKGLKEKLSSPKRHSFLVGPNEPNHTCRKQLLPLIINEEKFDISNIDEVFSIENVTNEFFKEYKELFLRLTESLEEVKMNNKLVKEEFENKNIKSSDFAKKLMGQIVFIYFLQKKGWLGVEKDAKWGSGPKNFFKLIFNECISREDNFFNDVLEPLFYKGLSEDVGDDHYSMFNYKVPFLNGGLFEPINDYDWIKTDIYLDNSIFKDIIDTFNEFNFTIKEDEPLEKEVAVDPEMLGKVFENLLEINDRKSKGAFYTPRHIVHYICQESLIYYLNSNSDVSEEDLRIFITKGDLAINSIIRVNEQKKKYNGKFFDRIQLPDSIKENSDVLEVLLKQVKVIDPAVGSGAFPVGMMNEIVKARYILRLLNGFEEINMYDLKRQTIENSLYGVDLELSATDVTKLRFWLSLVVDEEDIKEIKPLPNLDNQIMCGNSLVDSYGGIRLFDDGLIRKSGQQKLVITPEEIAFNELEEKKRDYFKTTGPKTKINLKNEINKLKWNFIKTQIEKSNDEEVINNIKKLEYSEDKPFFVWELEFSEIFKGDNPGFDIAIGNPPYVLLQNMDCSDEEKEYLENSFEVSQYKIDLYHLFFEKGIKLLKDNGTLGYITPNTFLMNKYLSKLRKFMIDNCRIDSISVIKDDVFENVAVDSSIILLTKEENLENRKNNEINIKIVEKNIEKIHNTSQSNFFEEDNFIFNVNITDEERNLIKKISDRKIMLGDIVRVSFGLQTKNKSEFVKNYKVDNNWKPCINGKDINPFSPINPTNYFLHDLNIKAGGCWDDNTHNTPIKIVIRQIGEYPIATIDVDSNYSLNTIYNLSGLDSNYDYYYILALINSNVIKYYWKINFYDSKVKFPKVKKTYLDKLPIPNVNIENQMKLSSISKKLIEINGLLQESDDEELRNSLNEMYLDLESKVYSLYGLNDEDINFIEDSLNE